MKKFVVNDKNGNTINSLVSNSKLGKIWIEDCDDKGFTLKMSTIKSGGGIYVPKNSNVYINKNNVVTVTDMSTKVGKIYTKTGESYGTVEFSNMTEEYINYLDKLNNIKPEMVNLLIPTSSMTTTIDLSDNIKSDIDIIEKANQEGLKCGIRGSNAYQEAYNKSVISQMVKDYTKSELSLSEIANTTSVGDVVETSEGLFVNNGTTLKKLQMTKEQYVELFPPVERYSSIQGGTGDCYFIADTLVSWMNNEKTFAEILQMFKVDSETNDVTITFNSKEYSKYPVTFKNGELFGMDGKTNYNWTYKSTSGILGAKGCKMLEQAYSIARFAHDKKVEVDNIDIDDSMSYIVSGVSSTNSKVLFGNNSNTNGDIYASSVNVMQRYKLSEKYLNYYSTQLENNTESLYTQFDTTLSEYGISPNHAYSIESIDKQNKTVNVINPWYSGVVIKIPYDVFLKNCYSIDSTIFKNK